MGCVSSAPEDKSNNQGGSDDENPQIKQQRRRLSVAPKHVGDITAGELKKDEAQPDAAKVVVANGSNINNNNNHHAANDRPKFRHTAQSKKGFVPYNRNKVNQDRFIVKYNLQGDHSMSLFGVMDGHGENGHHVASFVEEKLPYWLEQQGNLKANPEAAIPVAVKRLVDELAGSGINCAFSGTTCVFGIKIDNILYVANIGDSRCVMAQKVNDKVTALALSRDQKPEDPEEKARIIQCGGRVEPLPGPPGEDCGPPRVWLAEVDVPGLAMSRSIGDEVSQTVGVISVPEVKRHEITAKDHFIIWASDGVWEFLSNEQVIHVVNSQIHDLDAAASSLIQAAHERWSKEEEVVDDITCVIVQFTNE